MKNFLLGVVVGATAMGLYTGHIKVLNADDKPVVVPPPSTDPAA